jgi:aspartate aminotransferase
MNNFLSNSVKKLKSSPTIAITMLARTLKAEGRDIIELGAGEPDFDTPDNIKNAGIEAIRGGKTKYTPVDGIPVLKSAICAKFLRENELKYDVSEVTVGTGAKQTLFNCLMATINPGDEVVIPAPFWVSYPDIVELFGGVSVIVKTLPQNGFKMTADELKKVITPKTKWVILNSPSNPSGAVYTKSELEAIGAVVRANPHIYVLSDDIYEHIIYGTKFYTLPQVCSDLIERVFVLNGVSKGYAMTGWRIGYGAIKNKELIAAILKIQSQSTSNPCSVAQEAAVEALNGRQDFIPKFQEIFQKRRDLVVKGINSIPGLNCISPDGAFYVFFSIEGVIGKSFGGRVINSCMDFADFMLQNGVAVVPGSAFGYDNFVRISYATSEENLQKAIDRFREALS